MIKNEKYTLNNGFEIPKIGLGTWRIDNNIAPTLVKEAVALGYRLIDTAQAYGNENAIGAGIKSCGVAREELFIATKVTAEIKSYSEAAKSIDRSLKALGLDYIDLMLIHSPQPWSEFGNDYRYNDENLAVWEALEHAYNAGKVKSIGVSNFEVEDLENLIKNGSVKPMVNQVLAHIGNTPKKLIHFCQQNEIVVQAYSPIAHGELLSNKAVAAMAEKYQVSIPQLAIRYCLELGLLPLPKTTNPKNLQSNLAVDFNIEASDMEVLKSISTFDYGSAKGFPVFNINRS